MLTTGGLVLAGYHPATDRSNSMAPYIHRGDVLFSRPVLAAQVRIGDVITFPDPYFKGILLTHRVRAEQLLTDGRIAFTTRGDANPGSEHWTIAKDGQLTRLSFRVPEVGTLFIFIDAHPLYLAIAIVLAVWLALMRLIWKRDPGGTPHPRRARPHLHRRRRAHRIGGVPLVAIVAMLAVVPAAGAVGYVAANITTQSPPTLTLVVNDQGQPLFNVPEMKPGEVDTACEVVTNQGPADADVGIYASVSGTGLQSYLDLTVQRGTLPANAGSGSCAGFSPDSADYAGDGAGIIYSGLMSNFPTSADAPLEIPVNAWSPGQAIAYRMSVTLADTTPHRAETR